MPTRVNYKGEKRAKELARQQKQEEKRLRKQQRGEDQQQDADITEDDQTSG